MKIEVPVKFEGIVVVDVPSDIPNPREFAEKVSLCGILATMDNPDAPSEDAFDDYCDTLVVPAVDIDQVGELWDKALAATDNLSGEWTISK